MWANWGTPRDPIPSFSVPHSFTLKGSVSIRAVYPFTPLRGNVSWLWHSVMAWLCSHRSAARAFAHQPSVLQLWCVRGFFYPCVTEQSALVLCNWLCVCGQPLCSLVCISAKTHCKNLLSSCPFQDVGEMEPARLSTLRQAWEGGQCGSACFEIRKKGLFSPKP